MYVPPYLKYRRSVIPPYLKSKKIQRDVKVELPEMKGVKWDKLTKIIFSFSDFYSATDYLYYTAQGFNCIYEGRTGTGKTSGVINDEMYFLDHYANKRFQPENFEHFFRLGREINLDPRKIRQEFETNDFFVIDEAHLMMNKMRTISIQNRLANQFADLMRKAKIYMLLTTITGTQLDPDFFYYKGVFRKIYTFNKFRKKQMEYDIQFNATGYKNGKRYWDWIPFQNDLVENWCPSELHALADEMKENKGFGMSEEGYVDDATKRKQDEDEWKWKQVEKLLAKCTNEVELPELIKGFIKLKMNKGEIIETVNDYFQVKLLNREKLNTHIYRIKRNLV